ncbi:MAG: hypothetical protein RLZ98_545 [Pseudomonadota bacterium]|jgi:ribose 5-phosphate isomerase A
MDDWKKLAGETAATFIEDGMKVGLGTGSTAAYFIAALGRRVAEGLDVLCVPTSEATRAQAAALSIPLTTLDEHPYLDLTVDGADEIDNELRLVKGGGGALVREKIVATASERMIVVADQSKLVEVLGAFPLPVEIVPFGCEATRQMIEMMAGEADCEGDIVLRLGADGKPFVTDNGNYVLDCRFGEIREPELLADALQSIPGMVGHGLFIGLADVAIIGGPEGARVIEAPEPDYDEED